MSFKSGKGQCPFWPVGGSMVLFGSIIFGYFYVLQILILLYKFGYKNPCFNKLTCLVNKKNQINQLPVSATRWQHGYWICLATFIKLKINKKCYNLITAEEKEKISTDLESTKFRIFLKCALLNLEIFS